MAVLVGISDYSIFRGSLVYLACSREPKPNVVFGAGKIFRRREGIARSDSAGGLFLARTRV